jgi:hypothetical protein
MTFRKLTNTNGVEEERSYGVLICIEISMMTLELYKQWSSL